jgi:hypothetical protein
LGPSRHFAATQQFSQLALRAARCHLIRQSRPRHAPCLRSARPGIRFRARPQPDRGADDRLCTVVLEIPRGFGPRGPRGGASNNSTLRSGAAKEADPNPSRLADAQKGNNGGLWRTPRRQTRPNARRQDHVRGVRACAATGCCTARRDGAARCILRQQSSVPAKWPTPVGAQSQGSAWLQTRIAPQLQCGSGPRWPNAA